jgi:putative heme-binding domain-containing protein
MTFGPKHWAGDAIITGYSRGKLYRTQLAHTGAGYVARNHLLACLDMLTIDACVSPKGELVVAVHSGLPDWGNGPAGKGQLYKITYAGKNLAQPVAAWAESPRELRISFDREVKADQVRDLAKRAIIEHGPFVRAGDRFEKHRPGYAVVQQQLAAPRRRLAVHTVRLLDGNRTLSLLTAPHPVAEHYAVTLPGLGRSEKPGKGELAQHAEVDLDYDLCGVEATWKPKKGEAWSGWLPHLDPQVCKELLAGSGAHQALWESMKGAGKLTLKTKLDLWQMLRPAVQPGSKLDYVPTPEKVKLTLRGYFIRAVKVNGKDQQGVFDDDNKVGTIVTIAHVPKENEPLPVEVTLDKAEGEPRLYVTFTTAESDVDRPLPLRRFMLPWAQTKQADAAPAKAPPELDGGSWLRGRRVFYSDEASCGKCHSVRGIGGKIGPDLTNLVHRDYASVLKDVREPSAALNPDYVSYSVELDNGRTLTGTLRDGGDGTLIVGGTDGREQRIKRSSIEKLTASRTSIMPEGLDRTLGAEKMRDLLTFLLTEPLSPAPLERDGAPPPRSRAEVETVFKLVELPTRTEKKLRILLASGPKDHRPGEHDYPLWQRRWYNLLSLADNVTVELTQGFPKAAQLQKADVVVFYSNNPGWSKEAAKDLDAFFARGGGAVYLHYAVDGHRDADALADRIGLAWRGGQSKFRHGALDLTFPDAKHPVSRGLKGLKLIDESYWNLVGDLKKIDVIATGVEDGKAQPLMWTKRQGKGRVFVSIAGHYNWTFDDPLFRLLVLRGLCWSAGEPADRLSELITVGARMGE